MEAVITKIELSNKEQILTYLESTSKELTETLSSFTDEQFNISPAEGSWTAGQVAEHLLKSESGLSRVLTGRTGPTNRKPDEKNDLLQSTFLDFSTKLKSPDFIIPSTGPHNKELLIQNLKNNRKNLVALVRDLDLTLTCYDFPLPVFEELTRLEWLCFMICHSTRHIWQLKNIKNMISSI